jgi:membrane AbrB-like protein
LIVTAAHNFLAPTPWNLPPFFRRTGEFLLGVTIGSLFTLAVARLILAHLFPVFISIAGAIISGLICGYFFLRHSKIDPATAFFATPAGGAAEMASLARQYGGDEQLVATYHSTRIALIVLAVPLALTFFYHPTLSHAPPLSHWDLPHFSANAVVFLIGGMGAWLAVKFRLPGGMLIGTIIVIGLTNIVSGDALPPIPREFRYAAQILVGAAIGCSFNLAAIHRIRALYKLQLQTTALLLALSMIWALLLWAMTPLDLLTAVLSTAPAGCAEMTATAIALGADAPIVAAVQALRVIAVTVIMPILIRRIMQRQLNKPPFNQ